MTPRSSSLALLALTAGLVVGGCRKSATENKTSCVRDVLVGTDSLCYGVNDTYYLCRGEYSSGSLGNGNDQLAPPEYRTFDRDYVAMPKQFSGTQLGAQRSCGLDAKRHLWCWGGNAGPDLGSSAKPVEQSAFGEVDDFSFYSTLCTRRGDAVRCQWIPDNKVVDVAGLPAGIRYLAAGVQFGCAATDHEVYCFGRLAWANNHGSPHGTTADPFKYEPWDRAVRIDGPELNIAGLQVGTMSGCVLTREGKVFCFGSSDFGTLGNGEVLQCDEPCPDHNFRQLHEVKALGSDVKELGIALAACALKRDGSVWCWGHNIDGVVKQPGSPTEPTPLELPALGKDNLHLHFKGSACVTKHSGAIWCWGRNSYAQIAYCDGQRTCSPREVKIPCPP